MIAHARNRHGAATGAKDGARNVLVDRRKQPRRRINSIAQFHSEVSPSPRSIRVTDISPGGARLYTEIDMPPKFTLTVTGDDGISLRRDCRVIWQLGGELGVEFIDSRRR
jgi:hypothetical protein